MTFSIFTAVNVESKVLINLESVEHNYLKLGKSGVDEALRTVDNVPITCPTLVTQIAENWFCRKLSRYSHPPLVALCWTTLVHVVFFILIHSKALGI